MGEQLPFPDQPNKKFMTRDVKWLYRQSDSINKDAARMSRWIRPLVANNKKFDEGMVEYEKAYSYFEKSKSRKKLSREQREHLIALNLRQLHVLQKQMKPLKQTYKYAVRMTEAKEKMTLVFDTNRKTLMQLIQKGADQLPLWIGQTGKAPPPRCGRIPSNDAPQRGELVSAYVKDMWILAEVMDVDKKSNTVIVRDVDEEGQMFRVYTEQVILLPKWRLDPLSYPNIILPLDAVVLGLYPQTTCFYKGIVSNLPVVDSDNYHVTFEDEDSDGVFGPEASVPQRYIVPWIPVPAKTLCELVDELPFNYEQPDFKIEDITKQQTILRSIFETGTCSDEDVLKIKATGEHDDENVSHDRSRTVSSMEIDSSVNSLHDQNCEIESREEVSKSPSNDLELLEHQKPTDKFDRNSEAMLEVFDSNTPLERRKSTSVQIEHDSPPSEQGELSHVICQKNLSMKERFYFSPISTLESQNDVNEQSSVTQAMETDSHGVGLSPQQLGVDIDLLCESERQTNDKIESTKNTHETFEKKEKSKSACRTTKRYRALSTNNHHCKKRITSASRLLFCSNAPASDEAAKPPEAKNYDSDPEVSVNLQKYTLKNTNNMNFVSSGTQSAPRNHVEKQRVSMRLLARQKAKESSSALTKQATSHKASSGQKKSRKPPVQKESNSSSSSSNEDLSSAESELDSSSSTSENSSNEEDASKKSESRRKSKRTIKKLPKKQKGSKIRPVSKNPLLKSVAPSNQLATENPPNLQNNGSHSNTTAINEDEMYDVPIDELDADNIVVDETVVGRDTQVTVDLQPSLNVPDNIQSSVTLAGDQPSLSLPVQHQLSVNSSVEQSSRNLPVNTNTSASTALSEPTVSNIVVTPPTTQSERPETSAHGHRSENFVLNDTANRISSSSGDHLHVASANNRLHQHHSVSSVSNQPSSSLPVQHQLSVNSSVEQSSRNLPVNTNTSASTALVESTVSNVMGTQPTTQIVRPETSAHGHRSETFVLNNNVNMRGASSGDQLHAASAPNFHADFPPLNMLSTFYESPTLLDDNTNGDAQRAIIIRNLYRTFERRRRAKPYNRHNMPLSTSVDSSNTSHFSGFNVSQMLLTERFFNHVLRNVSNQQNSPGFAEVTYFYLQREHRLHITDPVLKFLQHEGSLPFFPPDSHRVTDFYYLTFHDHIVADYVFSSILVNGTQRRNENNPEPLINPGNEENLYNFTKTTYQKYLDYVANKGNAVLAERNVTNLPYQNNVAIPINQGNVTVSTNHGNAAFPAYQGNVAIPTNYVNAVIPAWHVNATNPAYRGNVAIPTVQGNVAFPAYQGNIAISTNQGHVAAPDYRGNVAIPAWQGNVANTVYRSNVAIPTNQGNVAVPAYQGNVVINAVQNHVDNSNVQEGVPGSSGLNNTYNPFGNSNSYN